MRLLTVVIVNHNSADYLENCLASLFRSNWLDRGQVVVVDNASTEGDFTMLRERHPKVRFLMNDTNAGFSAACNQGIRAFPSRFYLLLNPDCVVADQALEASVRFATENPGAAIVGCRILNPDGSLQLACRRRIPTASTALFRLSGLSRLFPRSALLARYNYGSHGTDVVQEVEAVSGSFMLIRSEALEQIGLLDEQFFLYGEDLDLCYRCLLGGWKVIYFPGATVIHHKRRSSSRSPELSTYHFYRSMELFYRKHFWPQASRLERYLVIAGIRGLYAIKRVSQRLTGRRGVGSDR